MTLVNSADFPILGKPVHGKKLVYLDSAATTQLPSQVLKAISEYYSRYHASVHRGIHQLSEEATQKYEDAREAIANFINASPEETIFTSGATESINLVAYAWGRANIKTGDEILVTDMEHHSNYVPWQQLAQEKKATLKSVPLKDNELDMEAAKKLITPKTKLFAFTQMSNVLGTVNPIKELCALTKNVGAISVVDGAQGVPHLGIDVKDVDCDFLAFSGHKLLGPDGIGVLYGRRELLESMPPFITGGGMISEVTPEKTSWNDLPCKFEAGSLKVSGAIGLAEAIRYLEAVGFGKITKHGDELTAYALAELRKIDGITIYAPAKPHSVLSFNLKNIHAHDVAAILDSEGIAVRAGHHCCQLLMRKLGVPATVRASFYIYNRKDEVDLLVKAIEKTKKVFDGN